MAHRALAATCLAALLFSGCNFTKVTLFEIKSTSDLDDDPDPSSDTHAPDDDVSSSGDGENCQTPPNAAGAEVELAPEFQSYYRVFDLGEISGVPNPIGGITVKFGDPSVLLVAGKSEKPEGAIYEVKVTRDPCGHIMEFASEGVLVAKTPYVDANLVYSPGKDLLFYTKWPQYTLCQLPYGSSSPAVQTNLINFGMEFIGDQGPGGLGFVPPGIPDVAGDLRVVTWPGGRWYHVDLKANGELFKVASIRKTKQLPNKPGGFAYVPAGSPGFESEAIIVSEFREYEPEKHRVVVYEVDNAGDPVVSTRKEFLTKFPRPWGAYFEPVTGDFLFLSWGAGANRVFLIQGFAPPPI
jgi:hypothetical protein